MISKELNSSSKAFKLQLRQLYESHNIVRDFSLARVTSNAPIIEALEAENI
jgi:hypothetical protein